MDVKSEPTLMSRFEPSWQNIKHWICNHLNMKACGEYMMVSLSYVFCFIIWIICSYMKWRHSKSKLCDRILGSMPSDRPKPSPVEFHFNEEANYLDRLCGKKLIGLQLAKWVVTVAVGPQWQLNSVIKYSPGFIYIGPESQTWDLSKNLHDPIFRPKVLHTKSP